MKPKEYRLALIYPSLVENAFFTYKSYTNAYDAAIRAMKSNKDLVATLIFNPTSQVVIKRKYADMKDGDVW